MSPRPVTVLYDFLQVRGGAELVTLGLQARLPGAQAVVASFDPGFFGELAPESVSALDPRPTAADLARRTQRTWWAFERHARRTRPGAALFSGHFAPLAAGAYAEGPRVFYAHATPLPFAAGDRNAVLDGLPALVRLAARPALALLRRRYARALGRMDRHYANSAFVAGRLHHAFGIEAEVLHPPCDTAPFVNSGQDDYYLSMGRHVPQKRIDLIIRAFRELPQHRLRVASDGSETVALRQLAAGANNIEFVATATREALAKEAGRCIATIHAGHEEAFGMTLVESLAAGKPVIAAASGGCGEIVDDGRTGLLVAGDPEPAALAAAVQTLTRERAAAMRPACERSAVDFAPERFYRTIDAALAQGRTR